MFTTTEKKQIQTPVSVPAKADPGCANGESCSPTHEEIARAAYCIYVAAGRTSGRSTENWLQAERSLRQHTDALHPAKPPVSATFPPHSAAVH